MSGRSDQDSEHRWFCARAPLAESEMRMESTTVCHPRAAGTEPSTAVGKAACGTVGIDCMWARRRSTSASTRRSIRSMRLCFTTSCT